MQMNRTVDRVAWRLVRAANIAADTAALPGCWMHPGKKTVDIFDPLNTYKAKN